METPKSLFGSLDPEGSTLDGESVHHIRKSTKQLRAHLHLLRQLEGQQKETEHLRQSVKELARMLAGQRDAEVLYSLFQDLISNTTDTELCDLMRELQDDLPHGDHLQTDLRRVLELTEEIEKNTHKLLSHEPEEKQIKPVLDARMAALCEAGRELLYADPTDWENLHNWRKQVKKLMYQFKLLQNKSPVDLDIIAHLEQLGDGLGKINDLKNLENFVEQQQLKCTRVHNHLLFEKLFTLIGVRRQDQLGLCRQVFSSYEQLNKA